MFELDFLKTDLERAEYLQDILITHATGGHSDESEYKILRQFFLDNSEYEKFLPNYVRVKRSLEQFWSFIKNKFPTYAERREFIWESFSSLLNYIEKGHNPITQSISTKQISKFGPNAIHYEIQKGLERIKNDPDGAITTARTILETTLKYIADNEKITYSGKEDLSQLYKKVAKKLNLSPEQHNEYIFKQILGGCSAIVSGLGILRNKLGDAHGKGINRVKPSPRHAEFAVNLSGTMSIFLIETYEVRKINF